MTTHRPKEATKPGEKAGKGSKGSLPLRGDSYQTHSLIAQGKSRKEIAASRYADWLAQKQKEEPEPQ